MESQNRFARILGNSLVYAALTVAVGSITLNSRLTLMTAIQNQEHLRQSRDDVRRFLVNSGLLLIGTSLLMYVNYGLLGLIINVAVNGLIIWRFYSGHNQTLEKVERNLHKKSLAI